LFKPFSQVDSSTTRKYGGTGLGLAICKQLSEIMGGKMWVESQMDKGTTFYFTIVAQSVPSSETNELYNYQPQLTGKRLLIVDDNKTNRQILTMQSNVWGMLTHAAESGGEALDWLRQGKQFDLAILDMHMPQMDGLTLAAEIRKQAGCQELPLVMLTSIDMPETSDKSLQANFAALLTKPIKQSHLYDVLIQVLDGQPIKVRTSYSLSLDIDPHLAQRLPLRILLAEDNMVNQQVALHLLQRMGYRADIAGNGLEVLEALSRQPYDVVLMDVQMPEMDGLTATRRICQALPQKERPRIIAMTANAMQGDREMCLEAGMDDYISKPIRVEELVRALSKCKEELQVSKCKEELQVSRLKVKSNEPSVASAALSEDNLQPSNLQLLTPTQCTTFNPSRAVLDATVFRELREMVNKDEILVKVVEGYLEDTPKLLQEMAEAATKGETASLERIAHTLKSTSALLGAISMSQLCKELEANGHDDSLASSAAMLSQVKTEYEKVEVALRQKLQHLSLS
jgi:CheY-like chemotaxis protein